MKDILFVLAPKCDIVSPPLSIPCLSAYLRKKGYDVEVLDLNLISYLERGEKYSEHWTVKFQEFWMNPPVVENYFAEKYEIVFRLLAKVSAEKPKVVAFTSWSTNFQVNVYLAGMIKTVCSDVKIVFGGPEIWMRMHAGTLADSQYSFVDAFVIGEGEETLAELMERFQSGQDIDDCQGIAYFNGDILQVNPARKRIFNFTELPAPDYSDFDLKNYTAHGLILNTYFNRGCINRCIYCDERKYWGAFRTKTGKQVFDEIREMKGRHPDLVHIYFNDSLINGNIRELREFCRHMIESGLKLNWEVNAVIRREMEPELLKLMHDAGCKRLIYGVESVSKEVLAHIGKVYSGNADIEKIVRDTAGAGIEVWLNFMFGLPGETEEDALMNIDFAVRNREYIHTVIPTFAFCNLSPVSDAFLEPEKYGINRNVHVCYWESEDGANVFPVRLARFERFCAEVNRYKISNTYPHEKLMDREKKLGSYYIHKNNIRKAVEYLQLAVEKEPWDTAMRDTLNKCREHLAQELLRA